ncbi:MAG: pentapeptide repeat-containing protein, partial [Polyangiaceae bacterium]
MTDPRSSSAKLRRLRTLIELTESLELVLIEQSGDAVARGLHDHLTRICTDTGRPFHAPAPGEPLLEWLHGQQVASSRRADGASPALYLAPIPAENEAFILARLNENRDNLVRDLRGVLCLTGGPGLLRRFANEAPSIWSMRSAVLEFDVLPAPGETVRDHDVFLAAAFRDEAAAAEIRSKLEADGVRVLLETESSWGLPQGLHAMSAAARRARYIVPLFSPDFRDSMVWRALAESTEMQEEPQELRKRMLPVLLGASAWPSFFSGLKPFDFTSPAARDREYSRLLAAVRGDPVDIGEVPPIDVLLLVALQDELAEVLAEVESTDAAFRLVRDRRGLPYHVAAVVNERGEHLGVAAAWAGAMGATAAATRASALIAELSPSCLAMCGICAGKRGDVSLGDVIVADRVWSFDHGKLVAADERREAAFFHDVTTYNLERAWQMDAAAFAQDREWTQRLSIQRPPSKERQARWILHNLYAREEEGAPGLLDLPDRVELFRVDVQGANDWPDRIRELEEEGLVAWATHSEPGAPKAGARGGGKAGAAPRGKATSPSRERMGASSAQRAGAGSGRTRRAGSGKKKLGGAGFWLRLTVSGRERVEKERVYYPDGLPTDPELRVHVGPMAMGNAVVEDPQLFDRLKRVGRKTIGVEMEGAAIGHVGELLPQKAIVVKGVSDYADRDKDDRYRQFAARASAAWLMAFLRKHLSPRERLEGVPSRATRGPERDRGVRIGRFHRRVEQAIRHKEPGAAVEWREAAAPVHQVLEVTRRDGDYWEQFPVGVVEGALSTDWLDAFLSGVVEKYRETDAFAAAWVVHTSTVPPEIAAFARRRGVRPWTFTELQGLLDFRDYLAHQTRQLKEDKVYPSRLFVPQRLTYVLGREEVVAEDALAHLSARLTHEGAQLFLILGDFGTGKTFLMHELSMRLAEAGSPLVPVLIELRKLDKARSLDELLGQHFVPERGMSRFDHGAFRYMLEQGRIALLFDGFDELVARVSYERASEHLDTVLQAAGGEAKVVITSRTQHFLTDLQVVTAFGKHAEKRGFRFMKLGTFDEARILNFLRRRLGSEASARARFELLGSVDDLAGLSENPRMLGFIADLTDEELLEARAKAKAKPGEKIGSAELYSALIERWLVHEFERRHPRGVLPGLGVEQRRSAAREVALLMWDRRAEEVRLEDIPRSLVDSVVALSVVEMDTGEALHEVGSGTLLCRDDAGNFRFLHRSVMEYLVAEEAALSLRDAGSAPWMTVAPISDLMADFFSGVAGRDRAVAWARGVLEGEASEVLTANATRVLWRLGEKLRRPLDRRGQDLRGQDFSGQDLSGALLDGADLSEALFVGADLSGASLSGTKLEGANFRGARLAGARLDKALGRGAVFENARLENAHLEGAQLRGADLRKSDLRKADLRGVDLSFAR